MKHKLKDFSKSKFTLFLLSIAIANLSFSQSVKRESISSYGSSNYQESILFSNTTGQCYNTVTATERDFSVIPGFQQPNKFSIEEIAVPLLSEMEVCIYPNPAAFSFTIKNEGLSELHYLNVTDLNGKEILFRQMSETDVTNVDCDNWENGMYLVTLTDNLNNKKSLRIIISK